MAVGGKRPLGKRNDVFDCFLGFLRGGLMVCLLLQ